MSDMIVIGVNTILVRDGKVLLGKRKNAYGAGQWGLPGGHLELGEKIEEAALRELVEETGITPKGLRFENIVDQATSPDNHYMQITFSALDFTGEPSLLEPEKCEGWAWFLLEELPDLLFGPHKETLRLYMTHGSFGVSPHPF